MLNFYSRFSYLIIRLNGKTTVHTYKHTSLEDLLARQLEEVARGSERCLRRNYTIVKIKLPVIILETLCRVYNDGDNTYTNKIFKEFKS